MKIPRWLEIQAEVDYLLWMLGNMSKESRKLSPIDRMIDKATGFDKETDKEATKIMKRIKKLVKEKKALNE